MRKLLLLGLFPGVALAEAKAESGVESLMGLLPLVFVFIVFYFFMIRPQMKKVKEHNVMIADMKKGDSIITAGGIEGKITKIIDEENKVEVEIAENVRIKILKNTVSQIMQ